MRLSTLLSKPPSDKFTQIESFLLGKKGNTGQAVNLNVGKTALNYFCETCGDLRTFYSRGKLSCIFVDKSMISIDTVLSCECGSKVQAWFLIESSNDITSFDPNVRIIKRCERLPNNVKINSKKYGKLTILLDLAEQAYQCGLGAGAIIYLRKVMELVIMQVADANNIQYKKHETGNPKNFTELLVKVDENCSIIPLEFSRNKKQLFEELCRCVHGVSVEETSIKNYRPLQRLILGILDNIINNEEFRGIKRIFNWSDGETV